MVFDRTLTSFGTRIVVHSLIFMLLHTKILWCHVQTIPWVVRCMLFEGWGNIECYPQITGMVPPNYASNPK